jgi:hypothetical protein
MIDQRIADLEAEVATLRNAISVALDLVAKAYDDDEPNDSYGNQAFAVLVHAQGTVPA